MIHVVIDTNVLLSGYGLSRNGPTVAIVKHLALGTFVNYTSPAMLEELASKLGSAKLAKAFPQPEQVLLDFASMSILVEPLRSERLDIFNDADDRVLETAVAAEASWIVTGDHKFLDLAFYNNIAIVAPAKFRDLLD